jgi:hypothetical protein
LFIVFSFPPQVIFLHCNRLVGVWQLGLFFFPMGTARKAADRALVEEMKKQKNAQGSVGHCLEDSLSGSTPKAEPRPKAAVSGEAVQSWTLRACSAFSVPPGRCPKDFRVFCFFISTACIVFHAFFNQRKTNV